VAGRREGADASEQQERELGARAGAAVEKEECRGKLEVKRKERRGREVSNCEIYNRMGRRGWKTTEER
jgi:hypothetical protein